MYVYLYNDSEKCDLFSGVGAKATELSALLEGLGVFKADGEGGGVHMVTVSEGHLVSACVWVDIWAVPLIRKISAIILAITFVGVWDTTTVSTSDLVSGT
jgi:hypothetical protein